MHFAILGILIGLDIISFCNVCGFLKLKFLFHTGVSNPIIHSTGIFVSLLAGLSGKIYLSETITNVVGIPTRN
jgi:hypothetical protein